MSINCIKLEKRQLNNKTHTHSDQELENRQPTKNVNISNKTRKVSTFMKMAVSKTFIIKEMKNINSTYRKTFRSGIGKPPTFGNGKVSTQ